MSISEIHNFLKHTKFSYKYENLNLYNVIVNDSTAFRLN